MCCGGMGPHFLGFELNHWEVAQLLLQYGADVNARDEHGDTLLHRAVGKFDSKSVRRLLECGADVHARDKDGKTPLRMALATKTSRREIITRIIELLHQHGTSDRADLR